jgi:hypothetical protein
VEILALIKGNALPPATAGLSRATLIVVPSHLVHQVRAKVC